MIELIIFFRVRLNLCLYFVGDVATRGASDQMCESARVDLVDFGPPNCDQTHVTNSEPSIALVKSNGYNFISQSSNREVTHGCLWML